MPKLIFALTPDDLVRQQIAKINAQLPTTGIKISTSNLHAELITIGDLSDDQIKTICQATSKLRCLEFNLQLDSREWWKESEQTCMGASQLPDALIDLIESLKKVLEPIGYKADKSAYRLQIPLMRRVKKPINPIQFKAINWLVRDFSLLVKQNSDSKDPYKVIQNWDFV